MSKSSKSKRSMYPPKPMMKGAEAVRTIAASLAKLRASVPDDGGPASVLFTICVRLLAILKSETFEVAGAGLLDTLIFTSGKLTEYHLADVAALVPPRAKA